MALGDPVFTDRGRAESFGSVAVNYDRYRPTYPDVLVDDLVALGSRSVLDVGCGTGKAAVLFAARGLDVLGVEIDPKMAAVARSHGVPVEVGSFEEWDAAGRRFDLLASGQAWHWVDPVLAVPKAAQVLRPGGAAALFWNDDALDEEVQGVLDEVYGDLAPELMQPPSSESDSLRRHIVAFEDSPGFDPVETRRYTWERSFTAEEWVGMCLTHSDHLMLPTVQRDALASGLRAAVERLGGLTVPYRTYLVLAHRAAG